MGIYDRTFNPKNFDGHAERNRQAVETVKYGLCKTRKALGIKETASIIFECMPSKAERIALSVLIKNADSIEDIQTAQEDARAFKDVTERSEITGANTIVCNMHSLIEDIKDFVALATDEGSEDGVHLSEREAKNADALQRKLANHVIDLSIYIEAKKVTKCK